MPKKKGGKKGAKITDGLATQEMSREQLMGHVKRMQTELEREREERNFFMLEREKLFSLWNMTLEQIAVEKDHARLMEVQVADTEKDKEEEMNLYKQKLRYLMMDQTKKLSTVRLQHLEKMKKVQDDTTAIQKAMQETLIGKKRELQRAKTSIHEILRRMKLESVNEVTRTRNDCGREIRCLESDFNRRLFIHQTNARCDEFLANVNIKKGEETEELIALHDEQREEMKGFYNEMTTNNFAIISALQNDVEELKLNENRLLMEIKNLKDELSKRNKRHSKVSCGVTEQNDYQGQDQQDQQDQGRGFGPDRSMYSTGVSNRSSSNKKKEVSYKISAIRTMEKILERKERYCTMLESANEAMLQRSLLAEKERDEMKTTIAKVLMEMQRKSSMAKLISELKLNAVTKGEVQGALNKEFNTDNTSNDMTGTGTAKYFDKDTRHLKGQASWENVGGREVARVWDPARSRVRRFTQEKSLIQNGVNNLDAPQEVTTRAQGGPSGSGLNIQEQKEPNNMSSLQVLDDDLTSIESPRSESEI